MTHAEVAATPDFSPPLDQARSGDPSAAERLMSMLDPIIRQSVFSHSLASSDKEDHLQDARERVFQTLVRSESFVGGNIHGFAYTVAKNRTLDTLRRRGRILFNPTDDIEPMLPHTPDITSETAVETDIQPLVDLLVGSGCDHDQSQAILLHHVDGFTYDEIAEMTGVNDGTVRSRISRGLQKTRSAWGIQKGAGPVRNLLDESNSPTE